jgi:hypothetical protein
VPRSPWNVSLAGGIVLALTFLVAAPAAHAVEVGDLAPEFEGRKFFNCDDLSLQALRGRVVLYELFSTG